MQFFVFLLPVCFGHRSPSVEKGENFLEIEYVDPAAMAKAGHKNGRVNMGGYCESLVGGSRV
jgi:hypothetical protein